MLDTVFKLVFGSAANKSLLVELLEALIPGKKIADVTFHDKEIPGFFVGDKKTVFDLPAAGADCHTSGGGTDPPAAGGWGRELGGQCAETELSAESGLYGEHPELRAAARGIGRFEGRVGQFLFGPFRREFRRTDDGCAALRISGTATAEGGPGPSGGVPDDAGEDRLRVPAHLLPGGAAGVIQRGVL